VDLSDVATLVNGIGTILPVGISGAMVVCFALYIKWQSRRQDKEREEHMVKWDSMITLQERAMQNLVNMHKEEQARTIDSHQREMNRHYALADRNTSALESLAHQLTIITKDMK